MLSLGKTSLQIENMATEGREITKSSFSTHLMSLGITGLVTAVLVSGFLILHSTSPDIRPMPGSEILSGLSLFLLIIGAALILRARYNITSGVGYTGFILVLCSISFFICSVTVMSLNLTNNPGTTFGAISLSLVLTMILFGIYYGSTGKGPLQRTVFYISIICLIIYAILYTMVFGNPLGVSSTAGELGKTDSVKYSLIYKDSASQKGAFKRTLYDQVYLSVAYPTLSPTDTPPEHNTQEISGIHSLSNYGNCLRLGANAYLFDIFYEKNPSSPNKNTWRVGTLNTQTGQSQNYQTISLASVLYATNQAVELSGTSNGGRVIYLFLNPRYTTDQLKQDTNSKLEDNLANLIQEQITYMTLPTLSVSMPQSTGMNTRIEDQTLDQAKQQVVIFLGGAKPVSRISPKLKNVIHGVVNLTDCYINTKNSQPFNAIAYDPAQKGSRVALGLGSFPASNENRLSDLVPIPKGGLQTSFLATLPDVSSPVAYTNEVPSYITHSTCFPFVYPKSLLPSSYDGAVNDPNKLFFQGFAPVVSPKGIVSMIFTNEDGDTGPARQRINDDLRCKETYNGQRVLNPEEDTQWPLLIYRPTSNKLQTKNWCSNYTGQNTGLSETILEDPGVGALVLHDPIHKNYSGGMIPKPTLVQTRDGVVYQLRKVVNQIEVEGKL